MIPAPGTTACDGGGGDVLPGVQRHAHTAMATVFEVLCAHEDAAYARQAAQAAFDLVDRLERELSRFLANSDVARINRLAPGESVRVHPWTLDCLQVARRVHDATGGAFDPAVGSGLGALELDPDDVSVRCLEAGARLDLGAIGKGYAVDRAAELLTEWGVEQAVVHGGFSSVLALEPAAGRGGWPLTLSEPETDRVLARITARQRALGCSGIRKRDHIVDPRSGRPVRDRRGAWVSVPRLERAGSLDSAAALADALSTAFMVLSVDEIARCRRRFPEIDVWLLPPSPEDHLMSVSAGRLEDEAAAAPIQQRRAPARAT